MPGRQMCLEFRKEVEPKRLTVNCPSQEARGVIWVNIALGEARKARTQELLKGRVKEETEHETQQSEEEVKKISTEETKRKEERDCRKEGTPEGRGEVFTGFREAHVSWGGKFPQWQGQKSGHGWWKCNRRGEWRQ